MGDLATITIARKLPRQDRSRALVDAIVEAAARILVQQGRDALTTNAVALRAGVSIGSLYQYFPNREAILVAVAHDHLDVVHQRIAAVDLHDADCLADAVARIISGLFAAHRINPSLHLALAREISAGSFCADLLTKPGAKVAVVALFDSVRRLIQNEIRCSDYQLAVSVAAEIGHALSHHAIECTDDYGRHDRLERETVRVVLAYLRFDH